MHPEDAISAHFRLNPGQISALRRLGLRTIAELLYHFPARYDALGGETSVQRIIPGEKVTLFGTLSKLKAKKLWRSRRPATEGWFEDSSGKVKCMWFNQPYIASYVPEDSFVKLTGTVGGSQASPYIANPEVEIVPKGAVSSGMFKENSAVPSGLFPVYPESRGITSRWFFHTLQRIFSSGVQQELMDPIPKSSRESLHLPDIATALVWMHAPANVRHAEAARKRFSFEEIFVIQAARAKERIQNDAERAFGVADASRRADEFLRSVPHPPTGAQKKAMAEILRDIERTQPMARLLEGDVGSGKTLVAAVASYATVHARPPGRTAGTLQVAYMAPTEILAAQHFEAFVQYFCDLPINIGLITGSACKKFPSKSTRGRATDISRSQLLKWIEGGEIAMLVGTHALIQKAVRFQHLALAIVDEQHRFGTRQRAALAKKSKEGAALPHFLSMTATPIPRTLALTIYGDLDLSVLDELPPGRAKVQTSIVSPKEREKAYDAVRRELQAGRQAYVICPRIEEPDPAKMNALQARSAKAEAKRLKSEVFPEFEIGLLHGSMKPKEKDDVMKDFANGKMHILVATSVVEVGINVPNATVMLIEGAERFGLAQLHQLRGRIQRSSHLPHCFLLPETSGEAAMKRLRALEKSSDGFALAEADLETRGAGDLLGRRQWGISDIGMEALKNPRLIHAAREEAMRAVSHDRELTRSPALKDRVERISRELHTE